MNIHCEVICIVPAVTQEGLANMRGPFDMDVYCVEFTVCADLRTYLLSYLSNYLLTDLITDLINYLLTDLLNYLFTYLLTLLLTYLLT